MSWACSRRGVWRPRRNKRLAQSLLCMVHALGEQAVIINVDQFGDDESHPSVRRGFPVADHALTTPQIRVLHSMRDKATPLIGNLLRRPTASRP